MASYKKYTSKLGLYFVQYLNSMPHMLYAEEPSRHFLTFKSGDVGVDSDITVNSRFYFDPISAEDNVYYIRSVRFPDQYIYVDGIAKIRRGSKPGNDGKFKLIRFDDGKYKMSTLQIQNVFLCTLEIFGVVMNYNGPESTCRWVIT